MSLTEIIVTGHRNPDTDAACSAVCYAHFKNKSDPHNTYKGVVCGALNPQTRFVFEKAGLPQPELLKDVHPRVIDIVNNDGLTLDEHEPIFEAIREIDENTVSVIPVFGSEHNFLGIIGIHEVASYFIKTNKRNKKQSYTFHTGNLPKVMPGKFLVRSKAQEIHAPIMIGSQDYEKTIGRMDSITEEKPVLVVGDRKRIIAHAVRNDFPLIVITNVHKGDELTIEADLKDFKGTIYLSESDTTDTIRLLWLSAPVKHIMNTKPLVLQHDQEFDDAKKTLLGSDLRGLPVLKDGHFAGIVTRRSFIEKPRRKIIMIDHNESDQSIAGAHEADVREILDHHRLAPEKTNAPIYVFSKPVGSSCTIVYMHFKMHSLEIERPYAILMLSGMMSDTLFLRSPTTTPDDKAAAQDLARLGGVDLAEFEKEILGKMTTLENLDPHKTVSGDFKIYQDFGLRTGIAQVETVSLDGVDAVLHKYQAALGMVKKENGLDWAMLLVTDVVNEDSVLIMTPFEKGEHELAYHKRADCLYHLPGVLSRKKQLLPEILRVMELARG
ncbi:MAG: putative manganese-dependent inorganic diphosphatase [Spirochaetales bacterium]